MCITITIKDLMLKPIERESIVTLVNLWNNTSFTRKNLPTIKQMEKDKLILEMNWTLEWQIIAIQTNGLSQWMGSYWLTKIFPKISMQGVDLRFSYLDKAHFGYINLSDIMTKTNAKQGV